MEDDEGTNEKLSDRASAANEVSVNPELTTTDDHLSEDSGLTGEASQRQLDVNVANNTMSSRPLPGLAEQTIPPKVDVALPRNHGQESDAARRWRRATKEVNQSRGAGNEQSSRHDKGQQDRRQSEPSNRQQDRRHSELSNRQQGQGRRHSEPANIILPDSYKVQMPVYDSEAVRRWRHATKELKEISKILKTSRR